VPAALLLAGALLLPCAATAQATPVAVPTLRIERAAGPIRIDGVLDDAGWRGAARASDFTEMRPREGAEPPVRTEVLVTYDERHLYLAFIAHGDPAEIRATLRNRDQIWSDDNVGVLIDPHGTAERGYWLVANPYGVQGDLLLTAQGEDDAWHAVFESAGRITETGYVVEMAIPFRSLRFPAADVQRWRINFWRNLPRTNRHQIVWAPISRDDPCTLCQSGWLEGMEGVRPGGGLELLPAVVASRSGSLADPGDPRSFRSGSPSASFGASAKYEMARGWVVEGTYNPDYSQVESDAAQVDVNTTFAIGYPERRPFFQEGGELYDTRLDVFNTRSINAPLFAAKLTGRSGRTSVGYVGARDERTPFVLAFEERSAVVQAGRSGTTVLRVRHNLWDDAYVGGLVADRRLDAGGSGSNLALDALLRFGRVYRVEAQLVASRTAEPDAPELTAHVPQLRFGRGGESYTAAFDGERFHGRAAHLSLNRSARHWSFNLAYNEASPTYRAETGFQRQNDFRRVNGNTSFALYLRRYGVEEVVPRIGFGHIANFGGERKDVWAIPGINLLLPRQTQLAVNGVYSTERFREIEFPGIRRVEASLRTVPGEALQLGMAVSSGRSIARTLATPVLGSGHEAELWGEIKPLHRLVVIPSVVHTALRHRESGEEFYSGYIARVRTELQFDRELSLRLVAQYNEFDGRLDVEPLLVYALNPFSIFYVGSTGGFRSFETDGWTGTSRQYFLKLQYLFRV
jgi:hypothetical protein